MATSLVPSGIRIFARYASSGASRTIVDLSVSISARASPSSILSPSFLSHDMIVPVSMVGERLGIPTTLCSGRSANKPLGIWTHKIAVRMKCSVTGAAHTELTWAVASCLWNYIMSLREKCGILEICCRGQPGNKKSVNKNPHNFHEPLSVCFYLPTEAICNSHYVVSRLEWAAFETSQLRVLLALLQSVSFKPIELEVKQIIKYLS